MNLHGQIDYYDRVIVQKSEQFTILHNANALTTAKITTEMYDFIDQLCKSGTKLDDVHEMVDSEEDFEYFFKNISNLIDKKIIRDKNDNSEYLNMDMQIDLDITNRCNLRCKHCCVSAGDASDLSTEQVLEIVDKILDVNPKQMTISGGEPLIRDDFEIITKKIRERYKGPLALMTNACLIDEEKAAFINDNYDCVSISIDGFDEESCSFIRGKGTFDKTINGIKKLQATGFTKISASMVLTTKTLDRKNDFLELCKSMNIKPGLRHLELVGRANDFLKDYVIVEEEPSAERLKLQVEASEEQIAKGNFEMFRCGAAYRQFQVDYIGNIFPCQSLMEQDLYLGNVLEIDDLNKYIRERKFTSLPGYKKLESCFPYNFTECHGCNKQIFCWNCVADIYRSGKKLKQCSYCNEAFEYFYK